MVQSTARKTRRRSAGEGSVYRNGNRWTGAVTWTDPDGTRHRRTVSGPTSEDVRGKLDKLRDALRLGNLAPTGDGTVGEYLAGWIERHRARVRPATWLECEVHVRVYLIPGIGRKPLSRLTATDVEDMLAKFMRDGRPMLPRDKKKPAPTSALTARHVRSTLRRALRDAVKAELIGRNVAADAAPPYLAYRPIVYLTTRETAKLLEATADDPLGPLYALAATTGLRRGELLGLTWEDVEKGTIKVRRAMAKSSSTSASAYGLGEVKTEKSRRTLPQPVRARQAIEMQRTRQRFAQAAAGSAWQDRDGLVFTDAAGRPLKPDYVSHRFAKDLRRAGIRHIRFHDLRHSAATTLLAAGVRLEVVSEWLGHSGIAITKDAYAAVVPELLVDAADAMDRAMDGAS